MLDGEHPVGYIDVVPSVTIRAEGPARAAPPRHDASFEVPGAALFWSMMCSTPAAPVRAAINELSTMGDRLIELAVLDRSRRPRAADRGNVRRRVSRSHAICRSKQRHLDGRLELSVELAGSVAGIIRSSTPRRAAAFSYARRTAGGDHRPRSRHRRAIRVDRRTRRKESAALRGKAVLTFRD